MTYIILLFGILVTLGGAVILVRPKYFFGRITKYGDALGLHVIAVIVRIILGVALGVGASDAKYPIVLQIFGWLTITAALILGGMGRARFRKLIKWAQELPRSFQRVAASFGILLGCFLIYELRELSKVKTTGASAILIDVIYEL